MVPGFVSPEVTEQCTVSDAKERLFWCLHRQRANDHHSVIRSRVIASTNRPPFRLLMGTVFNRFLPSVLTIFRFLVSVRFIQTPVDSVSISPNVKHSRHDKLISFARQLASSCLRVHICGCLATAVSPAPTRRLRRNHCSSLG